MPGFAEDAAVDIREGNLTALLELSRRLWVLSGAIGMLLDDG